MNSSSLILEFFEDVFVPYYNLGVGQSKRFRGFIRRFNEFAGSEAKLSDFNSETVAGFRGALRMRGLKPGYVSDVYNSIVKLWALAYQMEILDERSKPGSYRGLKFFRLIEAGDPSGELLKTIVAESGKPEGSITLMRWAVSWLSLVIGRPATVGDLRPDLIEAFLAQVKACNQGCTKSIRTWIRAAWWAAHKADLCDPPSGRDSPWENLTTIIHTAPPLVMDRIPEASKSHLIADYLRDSYFACRPGLADTSQHQFNVAVSTFGKYLNRPAVLSDLNNQTVGSFLVALNQTTKSAVATTNKNREHLLAIWRDAHSRGLLLTGPLVKPMAEPERIPTALTLDQLKQLRRSIPKIKGDFDGLKKCDLLRAAFSIQYVTAARLGAVLALTFGDIQGRDQERPARANC